MIVELLLFAFALLLLSQFFNRDKNLPPGPWRIPFLGNLPVLYLDEAKKLKEKYGDVFMKKTGAVNFVYLANYKLSKEVLSSVEFANRPNWESFHTFDEERMNKECGGIIMSTGLRWHHSRRFLLRNLRDLGMGKSKLESTMLIEVEGLVEEFKPLTKQPSKLPFSINITVLNVIWQLITGNRYEFGDEKVHDFMKSLTELQTGFITAALPTFFPFIKYIFPERFFDYLGNRKSFHTAIKKFKDIVQPSIDAHLAKLDPDHPTDLMDEYLIEMKNKSSREYSHFSIEDLMKTTFDLFVAGNDTTSNMTHFVLLYMAKFPHIQKKIQDEIDRVVPADTLPGLEHRDKLSYVDAAINEVQRHCSMIAFGVLRSNQNETTVNGYTIPKDSVITPLPGLDHKNPEYWSNPEEVDPTRFLDSENKFIAQRDGFHPFGIGKRQCLGEQFARMELYLIVSALLQKFTFSAPEGGEIDNKPLKLPMGHMPNKEQLFSINLRK